MICSLGAVPALALTVSRVSSLRRSAQKGEQLCRIRSINASRGTLPFAITSLSSEELPPKTAFASIGFRLIRRLLVLEIKFSDSMYAAIIGRSSVGRYSVLTLALDASNIGDSCSFGRKRLIILSVCPAESSVEEPPAALALPPPPPPDSAPGVSFFGSL